MEAFLPCVHHANKTWGKKYHKKIQLEAVEAQRAQLKTDISRLEKEINENQTTFTNVQNVVTQVKKVILFPFF